MIHAAIKFTALALLLTLGQMGFANELEQVLFKQAAEALAAAKSVDAPILSPTNYAKAVSYYESAQEKLSKGRNLDSIKKDLNSASSYLEKAMDVTRQAQTTLAPAIAARKGAIAAEAATYSSDTWEKAEKELFFAAEKLEDDNIKIASKIAGQAQALYETAELSAIKTHYLSSARKLVAQANKNQADRYAPITLAKATDLLARAEQGLEQNRYDTDEPRALAKEALYEAGHAIKITEMVTAIDDKKLTTEKLILSMETPITRIGESFNLKPKFDGSEEDPIADIQSNIKSLQNDSFELTERRKEILSLEQSIAELELRLGLQSDRLALQEERNRKIASVESLFTPEEAVVFKTGESLIIRMVGLNFQSGKATIDSQYFTLLGKVKSAIETFPGAAVLIEGHTDSFGSDSLNMTLSQERADAVKSYLLANVNPATKFSPIAQGYGETRPIGNNETEDGRRKNRRIDLVIQN